MPELQIQPHPRGNQCTKCQHWLRESAINMAYVNDQGAMAKVADLVRAGQSTAGLITARIAPCTRFPAWHPAPAQHWCAEYLFRFAMNGDDHVAS